MSIILQLDQFSFDISSACLHRGEGVDVYLLPQAEWKNACGGADDDMWRLERSLCGRQAAGAEFRDLFDDELEKLKFGRSPLEPCLYVNEERDI